MRNIPENNEFNDEAVTLIISRKVKTGREKDFEEWASGIAEAAGTFKGYLGTKNLKPSDEANHEYVVIIKFDSYVNLKRWEDSPLRADWLKRTRIFTEGDVQIQKLTGLEYWFEQKSSLPDSPPPRWKMAVVTFIALFPTISLLNYILKPILWSVQGTFRTAITVIISVALMTYIIMPGMTRLFSFWLFSRNK